MPSNKFSLNETKTELIIYRTPEHIGSLFTELKLLKGKYIFSSTKLLSMFECSNENVLEELKQLLSWQIFTFT